MTIWRWVAAVDGVPVASGVRRAGSAGEVADEIATEVRLAFPCAEVTVEVRAG